jgi:hypothetical protein
VAKILLSESGRSGEAGYTDPNNKYYRLNNQNEYGRERDALAESLIGIREYHLVSCTQAYRQKYVNARAIMY